MWDEKKPELISTLHPFLISMLKAIQFVVLFVILEFHFILWIHCQLKLKTEKAMITP